MSLKSLLVVTMACALAAMASGSRASAQLPAGPGPLGVHVGVEPSGTAYMCQIGVRSLVTGEGIVLEKFPAEPGKDTKFRKSVNGIDVEVEATIAPGGASLSYSVTVSTTKEKTPLGMYSAMLKLR